MARKRRPPEEKKGGDSWIMTYGDMMSLLLTFFVLLVSFSSIQESKFKQAATSLRGAFGVMNQQPSVISLQDPIIPHLTRKEREDLLHEVGKLEQSLLDTGLDKEVDIEVTDKGVAFRIDAPFLFDSGKASLRPETVEVMGNLGRFLQKFNYPIRVEGHTDSVPINNARFPSNWELSAARSVAVARYFQSLGVTPQRMAAMGFGEYQPLATNDTVEGRGKNRRVEIFLKLEKTEAASGQLPLQDEVNHDG